MDTFEEHLLDKAISYGFVEPKKSDWINYMQGDVHRGEQTIEKLTRAFGLKIPKEKNGRALDIGSGYGGFAKSLKSIYGEAYGIEIEADRTYWSKKRFPDIEYLHGNAIKLPWDDNYFDLIVANDVFEHVGFREQKSVAKEIYRTLKPGGIGYISVPNRFQIVDEHNYIWFGTYLPKHLRKAYFDLVSKNSRYLHCYERTGHGWKRLFARLGLSVTMWPTKLHTRFVVDRWEIFVNKH